MQITDPTVRTALLAFYKNRGVTAQNDVSDMAAMRNALTAVLPASVTDDDLAEVERVYATHSRVTTLVDEVRRRRAALPPEDPR